MMDHTPIVERRVRNRRENSCSECPRLHALEDRFDAEIQHIHESVNALNGEVRELREDVHQMAGSVASIKDSLATIANTMSKMADWPETWSKIQGFWSVMKWAKDNLMILLFVLLAIFAAGYVMVAAGKVFGG